ncbi:phage tail tape measure protein [Streptomyces sp. NPDC050421]|uniref:phage tail tape measure protein n=1 Tax=Streptomyces sp. NPDC050421 TaxID=3365613 RepID=UPI0037B427B0
MSDLTSGLQDASREVSSFGERAAGIAKIAGVGIAAALGVGIMTGLENGANNDLLAAQLGASPAEAKRLGEAAGAVYSSGYGESVADANEALKNLWQQGLVPAGATADEMTNISKSAMDVASVLGEEVGPTANAVGTMLKNGLAKNADEAFDIIVKGTQEGANKGEDLLDTFTEYGTQFRTMGIDGKTAMGLISQGLEGGARNADLVADTIKEFSIEAAAGGARVSGGFKTVGLDAAEMTAKFGKGGAAAKQALDETLTALNNMEPGTARNAAAIELFGTKAEDMGDALFSLDVGSAVEKLGKVDGAAKAAGDTMHDNAQTKITAFTRSLKTGVVDFLGGTVIPAIETLAGKLSWVGTTFTAVAGFVTRFSTPLSILAGIITAVLLPAMIAWAIQSATTMVASLTAWATTTASATTGAAAQVLAHWSVVGGWIRSAAQAVISAALVVGGWIAMGAQAMLQAARMAAAWLIAMGPIAIVIAAIVGLALIIWQNWDKIKEWTGAAFQWVWDKVKQVFGWLKDLFLNFTGPGLLIKHWDTIKRATVGAFTYVRDKAKAGLDAVVGFFTSLPGRILGIVGRVGSAASSVGRMIISKLGEGLSRVASFGQNIGQAVARGLKSAINGLIGLLNRAIPNRIGIGPVGVDIPANPIPSIRAMGGPASGLVRVGERGPEDVYLPNGSTVVPNHARSSGGGVVVNVRSNADPYAIGREVAWALRVAGA